MKKIISLLLALAAMLCAVFAFTSCLDGDQEELIVYTEAGFAPFEFTEKGSTKVIGVDMEIAQAIADKYNYKLKVVEGNFDTIVAGISEDNALGIAGISWTATRAEKIEYSDFYWGGAFQTVVYPVSANPELIDGAFAVSNFAGKELVYQTGTTSQMLISGNQSAWNISKTTDYTEVLTCLQEVDADTYLIVDSQVAAQLVATNAGYAYATIEGVDAESYGVVAKKGNTDLISKVNVVIAELLKTDANGKSQIDKWYEQYTTIAPEE